MEIGRLFRISTRSHLAGVILLFFFLEGLGLWLTAKFDYDRTSDRARMLLQKTAASLEERVKRTIVATDLILKFAAERIQETGLERRVSSRKEWERFRSYAEALPDTGSLWLLDAQADLLLDSTQYPSQPMNFSDREYFAPQRDRGIEIYIGPVVKGRITNKFSFTVTRRLTNREGGFAGVLVAAIETDDFTNFLRNIAIGENGAVAVWRTDGKLILRQPMEERYLDRDFRELKIFQIPLRESPAGVYFSDKTVDGVERLVAYQKMQDLPLLAVTSIPSASIRQAWFANVRNYAVAAALGFCGLIALSWLVYRSVRKEDAARRDLEAAHAQVTKLNIDLEQRVLERTSQLAAANRDLRREVEDRRRTEEALRESEARIRTFAEAAFEGIAVSTEGRILDCNEQFAAIVGYERRELAGLPIAEFIAPEDRPRVLENIIRGRESTVEHRVIRKDGASVIVEAHGKTLPGSSPTRRLTVIRDITEHKRTERELQKSEQHLQTLLENLPIGVWFADESGKILYGNAAGKEIWQGARYVPPEQFHEYKAWWQDTGMPLGPDDWAVTRAVRRGETSLNEVLEIECFDGSRKVINNSAVPLRTPEGRLFGVVVLNEDITERMRIEAELRLSEARFKLLSKTAGRLLQTENPQGVVEELCREVMAHLGCQVFFNFLADDESGRLRLNAFAGIPEEEARKLEWLDYGAAVCGCVARDGAPVIVENIFNAPDPRTDLVKSYGVQAYACHPLRVEGRLIGTLSFGTQKRTNFSPEELALMRTVADQVSTAMERLRLIQALQRSRDELEGRVRERTEELTRSQQRLQQLAAQLLQAQEKERKRVAVELHDGLLSELAAMKFLFEAKLMLLKKGQLDDIREFDRVTEIMQKAIKETRGIMNNLRPSILDELGLLPTIGWLLQEYQKSYGHIAVRKQVEVAEKEIPEILKVVIFRVLQESLNNFARHGKGDAVDLSLWKSESRLHLQIQDNGEGFEIGKVQKGLGLEGMRERVEISGGEFRVESAIGRGTAIWAAWKV